MEKPVALEKKLQLYFWVVGKFSIICNHSATFPFFMVQKTTCPASQEEANKIRYMKVHNGH
jgi:hypothetical protein